MTIFLVIENCNKVSTQQQWHRRRADKLSAVAACRSTKVGGGGTHKLSAARPAHSSSGEKTFVDFILITLFVTVVVLLLQILAELFAKKPKVLLAASTSFAGIVSEAGPSVTTVKAGDRVAGKWNQ